MPDFDVMTYGFPCQVFSSIGKRLGFLDEEKGNLFFESMRIAKEKKPKLLIAENVKGLLSQDKGKSFKTMLETLDSIGYNNYYSVLNSAFFDVPQARERLFIISIRKDIDTGLFKFPVGNLTDKTVADILNVSEDRKLCKNSLRPYLDKKYFVKDYQSKFKMKKLFDGVKEGYFKSSFLGNRIFSIHGVSPTLTTHNDTVFFEIKGYLTSKERFKLQGFNEEYVDLLKKNGISKSQIDKMIGNSVTVNTLEALFDEILKLNIL